MKNLCLGGYQVVSGDEVRSGIIIKGFLNPYVSRSNLYEPSNFQCHMNFGVTSLSVLPGWYLLFHHSEYTIL